MSALQLLEQLAQDGLLGEPVVANLRRQLQQATKPVTPEALLQLLVKKSLLTPDQARRALAAKPPPPPADDELGLAPDDDDDLLRPVDDDIVEPLMEPIPEIDVGPLEPDADVADRLSDDASVDVEPIQVESESETDADVEMPEDSSGRTVRRRKSGLAGLFASLGRGRRKKVSANRWDSPLMLVGGGGLIVLTAVGFLLYFYLLRGTGDEAFTAANDSYRQQAYGQAIGQFEHFLSGFPKHPKCSLARVKIGIAQIWSQVERQQWRDAHNTAVSELPKIREEEAFGDLREELASLLPEIMEGFADQALVADSIPAAQEYLELANQAFDQVNNSTYLPSSVRRSQQLRIEQIQDKLASVKRRINRDRELISAVGQIAQLAAEGQIAAAYGVRDQLLSTYPSVELDERLDQAILGVAEAERATVVAVTDVPQPLTSPPDSASQFRVVLSQTRGTPVTAGPDDVLAVTTNGAVFGLRRRDGQLRWRYHVGYESTFSPVSLQAIGSEDLLIVDLLRDELVRLTLDQGSVVWRLPCPGRLTRPKLAGGRLFVSCRVEAQAWVMEIDPQTGEVIKALRLPVPISTGVALDLANNRLVQPAAHSSIYTIDLQDYTCRGVTYLGHGQDSIAIPPVITDNTVIIVENPGVDFSLVHALALGTGDEGKLTALAKPLRIKGQTVTPAKVVERRIVLASDRGRINVLQLDPNQPGRPLRVVAEAAGTTSPGTVSHTLLDRGQLWVGDNQLTRYELQTSRGQLVRKWITNKGDRFLAPMQLSGGVLYHVRQRAGKAGATVTAAAIEDKDRAIWETDLAVPPASTPFIDRAAKQINVVTRNGALYALDAAAIRAGLDANPQYQIIDPNVPPLIDHTELPDGRRVFFGPPGSDRVVVLDDTQPTSLRSVTLDVGSGPTIVTTPVAFDQALMVATDVGTVAVLSADDGQPALSPFQPALGTEVKPQWLRPEVLPGGQQAVLAEAGGGLFHLQRVDQPQPHLVAIRQQTTDFALVAPPVVVGNILFCVGRTSQHDELRRYQLEDLQLKDQIALPGRLASGPYQIDTLVVLMTDQHQLVGVDAETQRFVTDPWKSAMAGRPVAHEDGMVIATVAGAIRRLNQQSGEVVAEVQLNEAVGSGPVNFAENRFILCAGDGTLHVVVVP